MAPLMPPQTWHPMAGPAMSRVRIAALIAGIGLVLLTAILPLWVGVLRGSPLDLIVVDPRGRIDHDLRLSGGLCWSIGLSLTALALHQRAPRQARLRAARLRPARLHPARLLPARLRPARLRLARLRLARLRAAKSGIPPLGVSLALVLITLIAGAARFYDLDALPYDMTSDHVEKLLDVAEVAGGRRPIFLANNGGREPLQFYWTAVLVTLGLPLSFLTLKIGMAIVGTLTIPLVFALGRTIGGPHLGLAAAVVLALAPWHLQILRTALRAGFSTAFAALCLWLLIRALTSGARNDWLWLGLATGCGLYGYTGFRPFLLVIALGTAIRLAYVAVTRCEMRRLAGHVAAACTIGAIAGAPLIRYACEWPDAFYHRSGSRLLLEHASWTTVAWQFVENMKRALLMFNVTSDSAWLHGPVGRPALEPIGGALFLLGVMIAMVHARRGDWRAALLLMALPVMLLASALALAFPNEVPHLTRAAGALPIVAILAALPIVELWRLARAWHPARGALLYALAVTALMVVMARGSAVRVFVEYRRAYAASAQPTRLGAGVVEAFLRRGGRLQDVYLLSWPHGWDHRALAIALGDPHWANVLTGHRPDMSDAAADAVHHPSGPAGRLYIVGGPSAATHIAFLTSLHDRGQVIVKWRRAPISGQTFATVFVPPV